MSGLGKLSISGEVATPWGGVGEAKNHCVSRIRCPTSLFELETLEKWGAVLPFPPSQPLIGYDTPRLRASPGEGPTPRTLPKAAGKILNKELNSHRV